MFDLVISFVVGIWVGSIVTIVTLAFLKASKDDHNQKHDEMYEC